MPGKTFLFALALLSLIRTNAQEIDSVTKPAVSKLHMAPQKEYLSAKSLIVPAIFINYGFSALASEELKELNTHIRNEVTEDAHSFKTNLDDYLQYAPAASVYALNLAGVKGRNGFTDRSVIFIITEILSSGVVATLKQVTHRLRPDSSTYNSFPSGHTTEAFVGAEFLNQEFGWRSPWYSIAGYTVATSIAFLRVMNNRHWLNDVVAGAGIGILSTKFSYWLYGKWEKARRPKQPLRY